MKTLPLNSALILIAVVLGFSSVTAAHATDILVVDPISDETIPVTEIAFSSLTEDQRKDVGDQLAEQGYRVRPNQSTKEASAEPADVNVVDPTSGETVSIADVDVSSLSDEDRRTIGDQLAEQGVNPEHGGRGGRP